MHSGRSSIRQGCVILHYWEGQSLSTETDSSVPSTKANRQKEVTVLILFFCRYWGSQLKTPGQDFPSSPTITQVGFN